jgi:cobalamin biosynthesis Mg chelatase CobN
MVSVINKRFPRKQPRTLIAAYYQNMNDEVRDGIRDQIIDEARKAGLR